MLCTDKVMASAGNNAQRDSKSKGKSKRRANLMLKYHFFYFVEGKEKIRQ